MTQRVVTRPIRDGRWCVLVVAALFAGLFVTAPSTVGPASAKTAAATSPVVVSLTYDDGTADQLQAATLMSKYGMVGTYYLNSSRMGAAGWISATQARSLQSAGHEIGGHTVTHADLLALGADEQARQICNDRVALLNAGLRATTFAYPYGNDDAAVHRVARDCGYNAARVISGVVSPEGCSGCPFAERIPPVNPYAIRTPASIKPTTTLAAMTGYVRQAEDNGGGWVVLVMHRVCSDCGNPYAVSPATLDAFLSWLAGRRAGGTVVKTVAQVVGGSVRPAVNGPVAPPPSGSSLLRNASMERDGNGDGVPDCWQRGGYGDNTATWSRAASAHSGTVAQQVSISRFVSGDRRIMTPQDLGACAPSTVAAHSYRVSGWYRSNGSNRLIAYYRDTASRWIFLGQSAVLPLSATGWRQAVWTTPPLPAQATALSVGISLRSVGFTAADDFALVDAGSGGGGSGGGDTTPPTARVSGPANGATVTGTVYITAAVADAGGIARVYFYRDGALLGSRIVTPYQWRWDTTTTAAGNHALHIEAVDAAGNRTRSATVTVRVT